MIDLDNEIELYKSKVAFYESQNTLGEYEVTVRELKFVVETLEALRSEKSQGDLISRESLKAKMFDIPKPKEGATFWDGVDAVGNLIDNAPAVECPQFNIFCENADEQAIADMKAELKRVLNEIKPKGEWIDDSPTSWKCSCCGYGVNRWNNTPFCPNCGIKMQSTEKEQ